MSLNAYISKRRMDTSAQLLEKTNMTVREIAAYVGIPDWNYFTKLFKKATGFTPSEYRKNMKKIKKVQTVARLKRSVSALLFVYVIYSSVNSIQSTLPL